MHVEPDTQDTATGRLDDVSAGSPAAEARPAQTESVAFEDGARAPDTDGKTHDPLDEPAVAAGRAVASAETAVAERWRVPVWLDQAAAWLWRLGVVAIALYGALRLFGLLRLVTIPLLVALIFTALLWPLRCALTNRRVPALVATWVVLLLAAGLVVGVGWLAAVGIYDQLQSSTNWAETREQAERWLVEGPLDLSPDDVDALESRVRDAVTTGILTVDAGRARLVAEVLGSLLLGLILLFFFVKDGPKMWRFLVRRTSPRRQPAVDAAGVAAFDALTGYARGVALTGLVDAVAVGLVLLVVGVPLALPLALLTFFAAFIPIVGATTAGALSTLVALVSVGPRAAIIVAVATIAIQQLEGDIVMPLVMRGRVRLHPAVILVVLAVGGALAGLIGAFVAVPLAAMATAALRELRPPSPATGTEATPAKPGAG